MLLLPHSPSGIFCTGPWDGRKWGDSTQENVSDAQAFRGGGFAGDRQGRPFRRLLGAPGARWVAHRSTPRRSPSSARSTAASHSTRATPCARCARRPSSSRCAASATSLLAASRASPGPDCARATRSPVFIAASCASSVGALRARASQVPPARDARAPARHAPAPSRRLARRQRRLRDGELRGARVPALLERAQLAWRDASSGGGLSAGLTGGT